MSQMAVKLELVCLDSWSSYGKMQLRQTIHTTYRLKYESLRLLYDLGKGIGARVQSYQIHFIAVDLEKLSPIGPSYWLSTEAYILVVSVEL